MPAKRKKKIETKITVAFPGSMEITKRNSENSLAIEARIGKELLGKLFIGRGSVEWWPNGNKTNSVKKNWRSFVDIHEREMK